jgi:hypothetical protein
MPRTLIPRRRKAARGSDLRVEALESRRLLNADPWLPFPGLTPSQVGPALAGLYIPHPRATAVGYSPVTVTSDLVAHPLGPNVALPSVSPAASATFVNTDTTTQGNWESAYGADGFDLAQDPSGNNPTIPAYATVAVTGAQLYTWSGSTADPRALQQSAPGSTNRVAATWYAGGSFGFDVHITDGAAHQIALYAMDFDNHNRAETVQVVDDATGAVLSTQTLNGFQNGVYLVWGVTGDVTFEVTNTAPGNNAVVSGLFFGGAPVVTNPVASASFVRTDAITEGNWRANYGADGFDIAQDPSSNDPTIPAYATVAVSGASLYTWNGNASDVRALQQSAPGSTNRIAATWYSGGSFSIDIHLTDGSTHQIALYAMDFDNHNRAETVQVVDDATGIVLNTQNLSGFQNGVYLVWNVKGNVTFKVINTGPANAVISGLFFGAEATPFSAPYTPAEVRHAYGVDQLSQNGAGQTIAIVDAFDAPNIANDLAVFDQSFGLPAANLIKAEPQGTPSFNANWALEISLDVEWAHAIAPAATILLVEAQSSSLSNLLSAVNYAVQQGANQVSMSWGGGDFVGETSNDSVFNHPGVTFLASAGDNGAGVEYPAASPYVTGVGGTSIQIDSSSNRLSETAWGGSGGGTSVGESRPSFQNGFQGSSGRDVPDVSYLADPNTGVVVYDSSSGGFFQVGGTSAGAPAWAGLIALVNQGRAALGKSSIGTGQTYGTNSVLYALAGGSSYTNPNGDFFDIISGSNGNSATTGYDRVTGLGSPVANKLVPDLINS